MKASSANIVSNETEQSLDTNDGQHLQSLSLMKNYKKKFEFPEYWVIILFGFAMVIVTAQVIFLIQFACAIVMRLLMSKEEFDKYGHKFPKWALLNVVKKSKGMGIGKDYLYERPPSKQAVNDKTDKSDLV